MRYPRFVAILPALLALVPAVSLAQAPAAAVPASDRKVAAAARLTGAAPKIDGVLDDAAWAAAQPFGEFVQRTPNPGQPASLRSEARVLYDDGALYVGVRMYDPNPDSIAAPLGRRDLTGIASDWAHVFVDSYRDRRTAFRFSVNPRGVQKDVFHSNDFNEDLGWDAVWESAAKVDAEGWSAEYRIPLSQLRFSTSGDAPWWGLQVSREVGRRNEVADWSPIRPDRNGFVSQFGTLEGISGLRPGRRLEVIPYSVARVTREPGSGDNPFWHRNDPFGSAGADVKYGITSNLTLTATLNPDFGQVEADPSQVNLSAFETFFAERRPFFTEGSDIFRFNVSFPYFVRSTGFGNDQPFYSRRLGRSPQAGNPGGIQHADRPEATTIIGAAKVSGKTAGGLSLGFMNALTGEETVRFVDGAGLRDEAVVEPMTNYMVARAIQDFRGGASAIGGIVASTHRSLDGDPRLDFLPSAAYVAGIDGRHRFAKNNWELRASALGSHVRGSEDAIAGIQTRAGHYFQRPDADHLDFDPTRTTLSGWLTDVKVEKTGGGYWRGGLYGHARSPGLEMNDLGFQRNTDWILQGSWLGYNHYDPQGPFRRWNFNVNQWNGWSFGGERLTTGFNFNGGFNLKNNWGGWVSSDTEIEALRADVLRGGPSFVGPSYSSLNGGFWTDGRKPISAEFNAGLFNEFGTSGGGWWGSAFLAWRPNARMRLSAGPNFNASQDPWIYVTQADTLGQHYVFSNIRQRSVSLSTRLSYAFTPTLTLELYAQPFIASGSYNDFKEVSDGHAAEFEDRFRRFGSQLTFVDSTNTYEVNLDGQPGAEFTFDRPDFNFKALRSNAVLRWEYRPGSALFVVWSQGRSSARGDGDFRLGRDVRRLFSPRETPATNVLLVKVNYWLNL